MMKSGRNMVDILSLKKKTIKQNMKTDFYFIMFFYLIIDLKAAYYHIN